jgi:hypothetical protein
MNTDGMGGEMGVDARAPKRGETGEFGVGVAIGGEVGRLGVRIVGIAVVGRIL